MLDGAAKTAIHVTQLLNDKLDMTLCTICILRFKSRWFRLGDTHTSSGLKVQPVAAMLPVFAGTVVVAHLLDPGIYCSGKSRCGTCRTWLVEDGIYKLILYEIVFYHDGSLIFETGSFNSRDDGEVLDRWSIR